MSRNTVDNDNLTVVGVTSREGRVSRNTDRQQQFVDEYCHVPRGTCE